jgi:hypothetical protein
MDVRTRFWAKVDIETDQPCWIWTGLTNAGTKNNRKWPYGQMRVKVGDRWRLVAAHRLAWQFERGAIPPGLWVLHRCDNTLCVRPDHLFLGNAQANTDDMKAKRRGKQWGWPDRAPSHKKAEVRPEVACAYCGKMFLPPLKRRNAVNCSLACSNRARVHRPLSPESLASYREKRGWT